MIELLIVITIIGVLATIGLGAAFGQSRKAAKDARYKSHLAALQIALENYYSDNKQYPNSNNMNQLLNAVSTGSNDYLRTDTISSIQQDLSATTFTYSKTLNGGRVVDYSLCVVLLVDPSPPYCVVGQ